MPEEKRIITLNANKTYKVRTAFLRGEELSNRDALREYQATRASFYGAMTYLKELGYEFTKRTVYCKNRKEIKHKMKKNEEK